MEIWVVNRILNLVPFSDSTIEKENGLVTEGWVDKHRLSQGL